MTTFTPSNRLAVLVQDDPAIADVWGTPTSTNFTLLDQSLDGIAAIDLTGKTTFSLSASSGATDQSRERMQSYTGTLAGTCTVTVPNVQKWGYTRNATSGNQNVVLTTGLSGANTVTLPSNSLWYLYWTDGSGNVSTLNSGFSSLSVTGSISVGGNASVSGNVSAVGSLSGATLSVPGNAALGGTTTFGISGFTINPNSGGNQVITLAPNQFLQYVPGTTTLQLATTGTLALSAPSTTISGNVSITGGLTVQGVAPVLANGGTYAISITGNAASATTALTASNALNANQVPWTGVTGKPYAFNQSVDIGAGVVFGNGQFQSNLVVNGDISVNGFGSLTGNSAFLNTAGVFVQSWNVAVGVATTNNMAATAFYTTSDVRGKYDVEPITADRARSWIEKGRPVTFRWKAGGKPSSGFIAQEEYLNGRSDSLIPVPDERPEYAESDGIVASGFRLTRDYNHDIAYLTAALQYVLKELDDLKAKGR